MTEHFRPGADVVDVMATLAASTAHAALWGRTNYGRAFDAVRRGARRRARAAVVAADPRRRPLQLQRPRARTSWRELAGRARHAWWLNPEHPRHWDTGDSARADRYGEIVPMVECRNLAQLGEFVHDIV